jgi:hypothetical protein
MDGMRLTNEQWWSYVLCACQGGHPQLLTILWRFFWGTDLNGIFYLPHKLTDFTTPSSSSLTPPLQMRCTPYHVSEYNDEPVT